VNVSAANGADEETGAPKQTGEKRKFLVVIVKRENGGCPTIRSER
jgi:hypothetical protein